MKSFSTLLLLIVSVSVAAEQGGRTPNLSKVDFRFHPRLLSHQGEAFFLPKVEAVTRTKGGDPLYEVLVYTRRSDEARALGIHPNSVDNEFFTALVTLDQIVALSNLASVQYVEAPRRYKPLLDKSVVEMKVDKLHAGQVNSTVYKGKNVIVGIIDSGIDWRHLDFRSDADTTKSRILSLWDQTATGTPPSGFTYGAEYSQALINDELDGTPTNLVLEQDFVGHGTHVAGIAVGDGSSSTSGFRGVAPEADIIIVKAGDNSFSSTRIIDGITYIRQKAVAAGKPFVINLSLGGHQGPHDGTTGEEIKVNDESGAAGRAIVIAAGNEGSDAIHADNSVTQGNSVTFQFTVPSYTAAGGAQNDIVSFDMWYKAGDQLTVAVRSPNGSTLTVASGSQNAIETSSGDGAIQILNAPSGPNPVNNAKQCAIDIFDNSAASPPRPGVWNVTVTGSTVTAGGTFDVWLYGSTIQAGDGTTPEISSGATYRKLVGQPGTADEGITVGAYVTKWTWQAIDGLTYGYVGTNRVNDYALFSSMGPTRDGRRKPEVSAPGQAIASAKSRSTTPAQNVTMPDNKHVIEQGTSMAAPHVAGLVALVFQAKASLTAAQVKNVLTSTTKKDAFTGTTPNDQWGYGKVDAVAAMGAALFVEKISEILPRKFTLEQNFPNPFNPSTQIRFSLASPGRAELKVHDILGREVVTLLDEYEDAGEYSTTWNAEAVPSGVYYYTLRSGGNVQTRAMVLMK